MKINKVLETALLKIYPKKGKNIIDQIVKNTNTLGYLTSGYSMVITATRALDLAFAWRDSPEGFDYWYDIYKELMNMEGKRSWKN